MNDERAGEGVEHLQVAALEMIEAARAFLDVVEELVGDRERLAEAAEVVGSMAGMAVRAAGLHRTVSDEPGDEAPRVERIVVS